MRTFAVGDIHGNIKALKQVLERSNFNYEKDVLIVLGDVFDGWPYVKDCVEELLRIKHIVYILGNHDLWALEWYWREDKYDSDTPENIWFCQGGEATIKSYGYGALPETHNEFFKKAKGYFVNNNMLFVHGGYRWTIDIKDNDIDDLIWDRYLIQTAIGMKKHKSKFGPYDKIFLGHTSTQNFTGKTDPIFACNVIDIDTGAGWSGKLTIMDVNTLEYWQSDSTDQLYEKHEGRGR